MQTQLDAIHTTLAAQPREERIARARAILSAMGVLCCVKERWERSSGFPARKPLVSMLDAVMR